MHILCTICSDLVNQAENIYVTKCGHIFHHHCLAQWIERSKSCPQCRHRVTEKCMVRLYPTISNELKPEDAATLQSRLDDALLQLRQQKAASKEKDDNLNNLNVELKKNVDLVKTYEKRLTSRESAITALKEQLDYVKIQNKETNRLKEENDALRKNLEMLNGLQKVLNATADEVEKMLESYTDVRTIALFATALKRALCESEAKKKDYRDRLHSTKQQYTVEKTLGDTLQANNVRLSERINLLKRKYERLKNKEIIRDETRDIPGKSRESLDQTVPGKSLDRSECETAAKQPRLDASVFNTGSLDFGIDISMNSMVNKIKNADSPYLNLKQSSVALALSDKHRAFSLPENGIKPSEFAIINSARSHALKSSESHARLSIFHKKQPMKPDPLKPEQMDLSYDGLGGHSKLDTFPVPKQRPMLKYVPKVTAKHKLKKPAAPSGSQDIANFLQKMSQDSNSD